MLQKHMKKCWNAWILCLHPCFQWNVCWRSLPLVCWYVPSSFTFNCFLSTWNACISWCAFKNKQKKPVLQKKKKITPGSLYPPCVFIWQNYFRDAWNVFDFVTVLGSITDILVTEIAVSTVCSICFIYQQSCTLSRHCTFSLPALFPRAAFGTHHVMMSLGDLAACFQ